MTTGLSTTGKVRVRYAPSPTGHPHLGNLRTAIINWLFARQYGGQFIIRIEDTDVERNDPRYERAQLEALRWLGLDWDEGPDVNGPYGPYRQSERASLYAESLAALLASGHAYYCFCTEALLQSERRLANSRNVPYVYSRRCRPLAPAESAARKAAGEAAVVRFDLHGAAPVLHDIIKGTIQYHGELLGDFVIARADGMPVYNFVAAVDDLAMGITHVLRGEDHLTNTPRQMAIQTALGQRSPAYGHLPLLLGESGAKLSKREGAFPIRRARRRGLLPEAVANYLACLGWSPSDLQLGEFFTLPELIQHYDLTRVSRSGAIVQESKLAWFNAQHLRHLPPERIYQALQEHYPLRFRGRPLPPSLCLPEAQAARIIAVLQPGFQSLKLALRDFRSVARRPSNRRLWRLLAPPLKKSQVAVLSAALESLPFMSGQEPAVVAGAIKELLARMKAEVLINPPDFYYLLRSALTGYPEGPELKLVLHLLSSEEISARLQRALEVR